MTVSSSNSGTNLTGYSTPSTNSTSATDKGTPIVNNSQNGISKNSFLQILTAELANQDPTGNNTDPTQYVTQLSQFSSLEQMQNLNTTMSLNAGNNMIGKDVTFSDVDNSGKPYSGVVTSVTEDSGNIMLNFAADSDGSSQSLNINDVTGVKSDSNSTTDSSNALSEASNLIGKSVKFSDTDSSGKNYSGTVKSVVKQGNTIGLAIDVTNSSGSTATQYFSYNDVIEVDPASSSSTASN